MPKESGSNYSSNSNSPKINESVALNHLGHRAVSDAVKNSNSNNRDSNGDELASSVHVTQPSRAAASGYVIFGGQVQIFDNEWKERQPMSGSFEYKFFDLCWDRGDCMLAFLLPCIYDCLLVTGMTKRPGLGCLVCLCPFGICCARGYVRKLRKIDRSNALPPVIWIGIIAKYGAKIGSVLGGRQLRKWWKKLPDEQKSAYTDKLIKHRLAYGFALLGFVGLFCYYYSSNVKETPITNRKRFILFSKEQLLEVAHLETTKTLKKYEGRILGLDTPAAHRALTIAHRLFEANKQMPGVADLEWRLTVVDDPKFANAFALPSGDLFVFTGLVNVVKNDDELAFILGHEMAHSILQHASERMSQNRLVDYLSVLMSFFLWIIIPLDVFALIGEGFSNKSLSFLFRLPYSRKLESEADQVGLILCARACFDVRYSSEFWRRMNAVKASAPLEMLSTHPANETRVQKLDDLMTYALILRKECKCADLPKEIDRFKPAQLK